MPCSGIRGGSGSHVHCPHDSCKGIAVQVWDTEGSWPTACCWPLSWHGTLRPRSHHSCQRLQVLSRDRHPAVHEGVLQHAADLLAAMPPECRQRLYSMLLSATSTQAAGSWRGRLCLAQQLRACSALEVSSTASSSALAWPLCQRSWAPAEVSLSLLSAHLTFPA